MNRRNWLWAALVAVPLAVTGVVYANQSVAQSYVCPITGEELPCEKCCPLNQKQQASDEGYTCPITGEELLCEKCCPVNDQK